MKKQLLTTQGDKTGTIDSLIKFLKEAKEKGATHYEMTWSHDPIWAFKWFETYRIKSDDELKKERVAELEQELNSLKS